MFALFYTQTLRFVKVFAVEKIIKLKDIEVTVDGLKVSVSGKKGSLSKDFSSPLFNKAIKVEKSGDEIKVFTQETRRNIKAAVGMIAAMIQTMAKGVTDGYQEKMKIVFMHFPVTVKVTGKEVTITNFLGEKSPRSAPIIGDTKVEIKGDEIFVSGINKEEVGQTCSNLEIATKITARDRRVYQDGIFKFSG